MKEINKVQLVGIQGDGSREGMSEEVTHDEQVAVGRAGAG